MKAEDPAPPGGLDAGAPSLMTSGQPLLIEKPTIQSLARHNASMTQQQLQQPLLAGQAQQHRSFAQDNMLVVGQGPASSSRRPPNQHHTVCCWNVPLHPFRQYLKTEYAGMSQVYCAGFLVMGPKWFPFVRTFLLTVLPLGFYLYFVLPSYLYGDFCLGATSSGGGAGISGIVNEGEGGRGGAGGMKMSTRGASFTAECPYYGVGEFSVWEAYLGVDPQMWRSEDGADEDEAKKSLAAGQRAVELDEGTTRREEGIGGAQSLKRSFDRGPERRRLETQIGADTGHDRWEKTQQQAEERVLVAELSGDRDARAESFTATGAAVEMQPEESIQALGASSRTSLLLRPGSGPAEEVESRTRGGTGKDAVTLAAQSAGTPSQLAAPTDGESLLPFEPGPVQLPNGVSISTPPPTSPPAPAPSSDRAASEKLVDPINLILPLPDYHTAFFFRFMATLGAVVIVLEVFTAFSNPGIVPRAPGRERRIGRQLPPRLMNIRGNVVKQKWCPTCDIFRPPRSKHCSYCDNCVLRFDHHCTWLGNCIGLFNYRFYLVLIYSTTLLLAVVLVSTWHVLGQSGRTKSILSCLTNLDNLTLYTFYLFCSIAWFGVALLALYHSGITCYNLTTSEHVKNADKVNPFDMGMKANARHVWCTPERLVNEGDTAELCYDGAQGQEHETVSLD